MELGAKSMRNPIPPRIVVFVVCDTRPIEGFVGGINANNAGGCGININTDINAAINIVRKVASAIVDSILQSGSSGDMITPVKRRVIPFKSFLRKNFGKF